MTAQEAAYECMQRVTRRIGYEHLTVELVETVEREFTEIISQVTPPSDLLCKFPGYVEGRGYAQQTVKIPPCPDGPRILAELGFPQEIEEPRPKPSRRRLWWKGWL